MLMMLPKGIRNSWNQRGGDTFAAWNESGSLLASLLHQDQQSVDTHRKDGGQKAAPEDLGGVHRAQTVKENLTPCEEEMRPLPVQQTEVQTVEDQVLQRLPGQPAFSDAHVQFKRKQLVRFSHSFRDSLSL